MSASGCYWGGELCARGHVVDCPARDGDPWSGEVTRETRATPMPPDDRDPSRCPTRCRGVQCVFTPGHAGECRAPMGPTQHANTMGLWRIDRGLE